MQLLRLLKTQEEELKEFFLTEDAQKNLNRKNQGSNLLKKFMYFTKQGKN